MPDKHSESRAGMADADLFYRQPILNSPYEEPSRHWELDKSGAPTQKIIEGRRPADFITPIPGPKNPRGGPVQGTLQTDATAAAISDADQEYHKAIINEIRHHVREWRKLPKSRWKVSPVSARLLEYWRGHRFAGIRPFFCQLEAVETAIWLFEVAPKNKRLKEKYLDYLENANSAANPGLPRLALKMATGSGKTTVMAMLIAWQALNAVRCNDSRFSRAFLVLAPGITIRDRLRVLLPNDPDSYYSTRELVPPDMLRDLRRARIVVTNFHAFRRREKMALSTGARKALQGWRNSELQSQETEGEMLSRVMPEFEGIKNIIVINDEAHHCYREKPGARQKAGAAELKERREAARLWISGIEAAGRRHGLRQVYDLTATPFFLAGSGYREGALFPWTMSDFSLMDAIECGIVKLPRVPVADNIPGAGLPMFRELWEHIKANMGRRSPGASPDPLALPTPLLTALDALYGHYRKVFELWQKEGISVPPCFIVVCNNTQTSKLIYEYIAGFRRPLEQGGERFEQGRLPLFRNFDDSGEPLARPRTLLIDSAQLESGEKLSREFLQAAGDEIERFRRAILQRGGKLAAELRAGRQPDDAAILREAMNTVGKKGQLGGEIRCVVSVGMLAEGWDANTVTHILGVRAFGSQLLCEQVIGRALRRQSYELGKDGLFAPEYADILGIPFDFAAKPVIAPPAEPREMTHVHAVSPERDSLEIRFPRVAGYRLELPSESLAAKFGGDSRLTLNPLLTGATDTLNSGIIGETASLTVEHLRNARENTVLMELTRHLLEKFRAEDGQIKYYLYGQLKRIAAQWLRDYFRCEGGTSPGQLLYRALADRACEKIYAAIANNFRTEQPVRLVLDSFAPEGSTRGVNFITPSRRLWRCDPAKSHLNYAVLDKGWEKEICRLAEKPEKGVIAYVKNFRLGFEVPYNAGGQAKFYEPDFILRVDGGKGGEINLVVEVKGYRNEDALVKKDTMENFWIPAVNSDGRFGRWAFLELRDFFRFEDGLDKALAMLRAGQDITGVNFDSLQSG